MWNKYKLVMLPTNEKAMIHLTESNMLIKSIELTGKSDLYKSNPQHLYILSDEEIKESDYGINTVTNSIFQYSGIGPIPPKSKKIIATTDKSLIALFGQSEKGYGKMKEGLPQPSQLFIEYFVSKYNKGNIITEVMVEYKEIEEYIPPRGCFEGDFYQGTGKFKLKINPDNTINIKPIKDSWSREEVKNLLRNFRTDILPFGQVNDFILNKWIEENL